jgi:iron uptake system EfeUOB component EfeO/EfeM
MLSIKKLTMATALAVAVTFTGCASKGAENTNSKKSEQVEVKESTEKLSITEGSKKMKHALEEMKEYLEEKKDDKVIAEAEEMHEVWELVEDEVKEKSSELYEKAESPIGVIKAGIKVKPLDEKTLNLAIVELNKVLDEIERLK